MINYTDDNTPETLTQAEIDVYNFDCEASILEPIMPIWGDEDLRVECDRCGELFDELDEHYLCQTCARETQKYA